MVETPPLFHALAFQNFHGIRLTIFAKFSAISSQIPRITRYWKLICANAVKDSIGIKLILPVRSTVQPFGMHNSESMIHIVLVAIQLLLITRL